MFPLIFKIFIVVFKKSLSVVFFHFYYYLGAFSCLSLIRIARNLFVFLDSAAFSLADSLLYLFP